MTPRALPHNAVEQAATRPRFVRFTVNVPDAELDRLAQAHQRDEVA